MSPAWMPSPNAPRRARARRHGLARDHLRERRPRVRDRVADVRRREEAQRRRRHERRRAEGRARGRQRRVDLVRLVKDLRVGRHTAQDDHVQGVHLEHVAAVVVRAQVLRPRLHHRGLAEHWFSASADVPQHTRESPELALPSCLQLTTISVGFPWWQEHAGRLEQMRQPYERECERCHGAHPGASGHRFPAWRPSQGRPGPSRPSQGRPAAPGLRISCDSPSTSPLFALQRSCQSSPAARIRR